MNDCPNADVRDLLPDLANERLDPGAHAMVESHVAGCVDCAAEFALLRQLRASRPTPAIDVAAIVAALPAYRAPVRRSWVGWRAAAAITILVAGASSVAVLQRGVPSADGGRVLPNPVPAQVAASPVGPAPTAVASATTTTPAPHVEAPARTAAPSAGAREPVVSRPVRELAMGGGAIGDLDDRELTSLLKDIESLDAVPSVEVESTPVSPIAPSRP